MRPALALLGVLLSVGACASPEPEARPEPRVGDETCEVGIEARRLAVSDPSAALALLDAALPKHAPGSACRRRIVALLGALESAGPAVALRAADEVGEITPEEPARSEHSSVARGRPPMLVVLDPGHGGNEFGATSDGFRESRLTLDIAKRTARILRARQPELEVRLTRDADSRVSLEQRASLANAIGAAAFVSIHLNDAEGEVRRGGVTTFVLDTTDDAQAIRLAARENGTTVEEVGTISKLLASLERRAQLEASRRLAESVHGETLRGARRHLPRIPNRGIRPALFKVLVGARMPAILLEASFMNIPGEREALRTARYRESLAQGIAQGILRFFFEEA